METCPFCQGKLPKHTRQCFHGGIPHASHIDSHEDRKRQAEVEKLNKAITDPNKIVIDGNGGNLRDRAS